ncbi:MAG TPA: hypothetical protein VMV69_22100 [Pirellulales bacterium]|nr:hypothetical protein [Pirellulales bacterium]
MSFQHDQMAHAATSRLLGDIRRGNNGWLPAGRLTNVSTYWQGVIDWPRPDNAFQDLSRGSSLAVEFKPPGHGKSEYVRGLGQALTYLDAFELALLIVPSRAIDGFDIAEYLGAILNSDYAAALAIGVMAFAANPAELRIVVPVRPRAGDAPPLPSGRTVFWAYWRDLSQHDLYMLLVLLDKKQCTFDEAYDLYWKRRMARAARTWEGKPRKKPDATKSFASEQANDGLSMRHVALIDSSWRLTAEGYELLRTGKVYGPESQAFLSKLAQRVLLDGRHLELIFWIEETQRRLALADKQEHLQFRSSLDRELQGAGIIPHLPIATGKTTFLRDEPKLWNKLGLLVTGPRSYFFPGEGYRFNWRQIVSVVSMT